MFEHPHFLHTQSTAETYLASTEYHYVCALIFNLSRYLVYKIVSEWEYWDEGNDYANRLPAKEVHNKMPCIENPNDSL
jgi:hypothetical protein